MKQDGRVFQREPVRVKLWEIPCNSVHRTPDPETRRKKTKPEDTLVIDFGSSLTRAGFSSAPEPTLIFNSIVSKTKRGKDDIVYVGNMIKETDLAKASVKSPFEKGVISDFSNFEFLTDYVMKNMGYCDFPVGGDLLYTEAFCNLSLKRAKTHEIFFEAYGFDRLIPLSEPLVSLFDHQKDAPLEALAADFGMLVSMGAKSCLVVPIVKGAADFAHSKRINVGTTDSFNLLYKTLNLKYEHLRPKFSLKAIKAIFDIFSFTAKDYDAQLQYFRLGLNGFKHQAYVHPLVLDHDAQLLESLDGLVREPYFLEFYETESEKQLYEEEQQRRKKTRQEQAARIREAMQQKREEKKAQQRTELEKLERLRQLKEEDPEQFKSELQFLEIESPKELEKLIKKLKLKLGVLSKAELESDRYSYIKIPDSELNPQQLRVKRMQVMHQQAAEQRLLKKEEKARQREEMNRLKTEDPARYIRMLYERRKGLKDEIRKIKAFKEDSHLRKAKNQRMLNIIDSYLDGEKPDVELHTLNKEINNASNSDIEHFESKLQEVETELREVDPDFEDEATLCANMFRVGSTIEFAVDAVRPIEALYQPYFVGNDQMGVSETIQFIANKYPKETRHKLLSNVFLRGGGANVSGQAERIRFDIERCLEEPLEVKVHVSEDALMSNWKLMSRMAGQKKALEPFWISRREYEEYGESADHLKQFAFSNHALH